MGILGGLVNAAKNISIKTAVAVSNPVTLVTKGYDAALQKTSSSSLTTNITKIITNTALAAGAVVGGAAAAAASRAGTLGSLVANTASKVVPTTLKGKVLGGTAALVGAGLTISNPAKAAETISSAPSSLVNFGKNVGEFASNPTTQNLSNIVKENPIVSGVVGTAAAVVGAKTLLAVSQTVATERNTAAIENIATSGLPTGNQNPTSAISTNPQAAVLPQTKAISSGNITRKRSKRKKSNQTPNINIKIDDRDIYVNEPKSIKRRKY